ncbi:hypothetical protein L2E82_06440 [Cichorium intybus]|uniref:Uncharacterized protein n=1 Tax=Cichorium intybus TaxID=13427 RepID=A0ACB9HAI0_CICIN|nr:hypothetical protein L2E82_06440 [Cichorium intybus]
MRRTPVRTITTDTGLFLELSRLQIGSRRPPSRRHNRSQVPPPPPPPTFSISLVLSHKRTRTSNTDRLHLKSWYMQPKEYLSHVTYQWLNL